MIFFPPRELLELSEEDKLQAAMDVAEAVYFIHNLSNPVVHQVSLRNHKKGFFILDLESWLFIRLS